MRRITTEEIGRFITKFPIKGIVTLYCGLEKGKYDCEMYGKSMGGSDLPLIGTAMAEVVNIEHSDRVNIAPTTIITHGRNISCNKQRTGGKDILNCDELG